LSGRRKFLAAGVAFDANKCGGFGSNIDWKSGAEDGMKGKGFFDLINIMMKAFSFGIHNS
jgi:hypothetical protein